MRALIVGCGYVGLPLGIELAGRGHEVYGLRRSAASAAELAAHGLRPLAADITRPEELEGLPGDFDWVVNCVSSTRGGVEDYRRVYRDGTRHLLAWLSVKPPAKYVYTSSTGVYGQTDGSVVTEASATEATTVTSQVLLETEQLLLAAARERGFPAIILRLAGIYGPGRGYWLKQFLRNEAVMEGAGERVLNMVHRDDAVAAAVAALERGQPGEIFNVVDDEPVAQRELLTWLSRRLGRPLPPAAPEDATAVRKRGLTSKRVSNGKLKAALGFRFKYPTFREGFEALLPLET